MRGPTVFRVMGLNEIPYRVTTNREISSFYLNPRPRKKEDKEALGKED